MSPSVNAVYRSLFTNKPKDITHKKIHGNIGNRFLAQHRSVRHLALDVLHINKYASPALHWHKWIFFLIKS